MREIIFKAKRKDNGEWVEGALFDGENYCVIGQEIKFSPDIQNECKIVGYVVDRNTICQYTGLTDKNGNKIWENDIVSGHDNPNDLAKIVFGEFAVIEVESLDKVDGVIGWHTEVIPTDSLSKCEPFCLSMPLTDFYIGLSEWEVIGNIFDNPELAKENEHDGIGQGY